MLGGDAKAVSVGVRGRTVEGGPKSKLLAGLVEFLSEGNVPTGLGANVLPGEDFRTSHAKDVGLF